MNADQQCLKSQLTATVGALLVQSVQFNDKFKLSGWITVSADDGDPFSISIEQEFNSEARNNILGVNYTDEFDTHAVRNNAMNTIENFDSAFTNRHVPLSSLSQERAIKKEPTWCAMERETRENSSVPQTAQSSLFNNSFTVKLTSIWQHFTNKAKQFAAATDSVRSASNSNASKSTTNNDTRAFEAGRKFILNNNASSASSATPNLQASMNSEDVKPIINDKGQIVNRATAHDNVSTSANQTTNDPTSLPMNGRKRKNETDDASRKKPALFQNDSSNFLPPLPTESKHTLKTFTRWLITKPEVCASTASKYESAVKKAIRLARGIPQLDSNTMLVYYFLPALNDAKKENCNSSIVTHHLKALSFFCDFALDTLPLDDDRRDRYEQLKTDIVTWDKYARDELKPPLVM